MNADDLSLSQFLNYFKQTKLNIKEVFDYGSKERSKVEYDFILSMIKRYEYYLSDISLILDILKSKKEEMEENNSCIKNLIRNNLKSKKEETEQNISCIKNLILDILKSKKEETEQNISCFNLANKQGVLGFQLEPSENDVNRTNLELNEDKLKSAETPINIEYIPSDRDRD